MRIKLSVLKRALLFTVTSIVFATSLAQAQERSVASIDPADLTPHRSTPDLPLYEIGMGLGGEIDPHYPGSDQSQWYAVPFPFLLYRGRILRSDQDGTRAQVINGTQFNLSMSGAGAFPVESNNDNARRGMADLGWMGQLGPKIHVELKSWDDHSFIRAGVSARAAYSATDVNSITHRGFVYEAELVYQKPNFFRERLDLYAIVTSVFASEKYMDYLYGVETGYATPSRAAYSSKPGYLESNLQTGLSYRTPDGHQKFMLNLQAGTLAGAANIDSPLVRSHLDLSAGVAWAWTFYQSSAKAVLLD